MKTMALSLEPPTSEGGRASASIEVVEAGGVHRDIGVPAGGLTVGRSPDQALVLGSPTVSKHHARFFWRGDDLFVEDLQSCNGTRRDGLRLSQPTLLRDGDELVLGGAAVLRVSIHHAQFGAPPSELARDVSLVPAEIPGLDESHPPLELDLLPVVTRLYQATSYEELGLQLTRTVGEVLDASRVALLEVGEAERVRAVAIYKHARYDPRPLEDASFVSATVLRRTLESGVALFTEGAIALSASIMRSGAHSAAGVRIQPRDGRRLVLYADAIIGEPPLTPAHARALEVIAAHAVGAFDALAAGLRTAHDQRRFDQLRRYFSPDVVEHILSGNADVVDKPKMVHATVLFADLVGYTKLSERLAGEPERLSFLLNQWLDTGAQAVLDHGGTLDKFIGDCVMALFGAPFPQMHAELAAIRCALDMRDRIAAIAAQSGEDLKITVGINTGPMLAGSVGSKRRLEYTVLGDTVNVA
ncbi:MAG: FHA domain-containing protein, partial [Myxococcales bacterium]|nr:FHA domain-containing protein [Myxococcales bacterium]